MLLFGAMEGEGSRCNGALPALGAEATVLPLQQLDHQRGVAMDELKKEARSRRSSCTIGLPVGRVRWLRISIANGRFLTEL